MYANSGGCMCKIVDDSAEFNLEFINEPSDIPTYLCFVVFYSTDTTTKPIVPTYTVVSRGYLKLEGVSTGAQLAEKVNGSVVTTFAGPMTSGYKVDIDKGVVGDILKDFEYTVDCHLHLGDKGDKGDQSAETAPKSLLSKQEHEHHINEYTEHMYRMKEAAGLKEAQSFIYKGIPGVIAPLIFGDFIPPSMVAIEVFNHSLHRALRRMRLSEAKFISILETDILSAWQVMRVKHVIIETLNIINVLQYTNDRILNKNVDVHQDVRLVNNGDCEDFAWALV